MQLQNLEMVLGETWISTITFTDDAGNPVDLTGYTFAMQVWPDWSGVGNVLLDLTMAAGITVTANLGLVTLRAEVPTDIRASQGVYDLYMRDPDGVVSYPRSGEVTFVRTVTRVA